MPIKSGQSQAVVAGNIAKLVGEGYPQKQAAAIAFDNASRVKRDRRRPLSSASEDLDMSTRSMVSDDDLKNAVERLGSSPSAVKRAAGILRAPQGREAHKPGYDPDADMLLKDARPDRNARSLGGIEAAQGRRALSTAAGSAREAHDAIRSRLESYRPTYAHRPQSPVREDESMPMPEGMARPFPDYWRASDEEKDAAANALKPVTYEYKPEARAMGMPGGRVAGIIAQDAERAPLSKTMVDDTPQGKMVDQVKATSLALALVGRMNERLRALEGKRG